MTGETCDIVTMIEILDEIFWILQINQQKKNQQESNKNLLSLVEIVCTAS